MSDQHTPDRHAEQASDAEDTIIAGHNYDGIQEYDNPMPGWWLGLFWATIIFAPIYILGVHVFGYIDTYDDDLQESMAELQEIRAAWEEQNPSFEPTAENLAAYVGDQEAIAAGRAIFTANCVACHGPAGGGLIGPNLTDEYWIHGPKNQDLFRVITNGVLEKGMTPWESVLSPVERAQVIAFIRSIEGTNPPDARDPQGDYYGDDDEGDDDSGDDDHDEAGERESSA
jgi:cytochrome c oxidase cbb3-type subunit 3